MRTSLSLKFYLALGTLYLALVLFGPHLTCYVKPFLLLTLMLAVAQASAFQYKNMLLVALFCSWLGDVALIFQGATYFILGLVSFLVSHFFYIILFVKLIQGDMRQNKSALLFIAGIALAYLFGILSFLMPYLGDIRLPVIVYALTICTMGTTAAMGFLNWPSPARYWILGGAIAFVMSDSLLAINKFYAPLPQASLGIMLTYIIAQYSIVRGVLGLQNR